MNPLIIALDFDGTLCIGNRFPTIGEPRMWLIEKAIDWKKRGHKLILWTCRENITHETPDSFFPIGNHLTDAVEWCKKFGLEFDAVNDNLDSSNICRKIFAHYYIDDKAIAFDDNKQIAYGMNSMAYEF